MSKKGGENVLIKSKETEFKVELVFKILYFILTLLSFNTFTARKSFITYFSIVIVLFSGFIFLSRITHLRDYTSKYTILFFLFILSYVVASIHTIQYGFMDNLKAIVWMCIQFFIVFARDKSQPTEYSKKEFKIISTIFLIYSGLMALIALIMMVFKWEYFSVVDEYYVIGGGFLWNRLYGSYIDPNYGAIFSLVSIILSCYFVQIVENRKLKMVLIINLIVEYLYICFSDSRTGRLAVLLSIFVLSFLEVRKLKTIEFKNKSICLTGKRRVLVSLLIPVLISTSLWAGTYLVRNTTSIIRTSIAAIQIRKEMKQTGTILTEEELAILVDADRVGRHEEEINNGDVSNNRFAIWDNAIDIFKDNPITGISYRNIREYANDKIQDGFISTSGFESMHNTFFDILVSQGIIGVLLITIMLFFFIKEEVAIFKDNPSKTNVFLISVIVAIATTMVSYTEVLYINTGGSFLFYFIIGLLVSNVFPNKPNLSNNK